MEDTTVEEFEQEVNKLSEVDFEGIEPLTTKEAVELMHDAHVKHVTYIESFVPGFTAFELNRDVCFIPRKITLHKGIYHVLQPESMEQLKAEEKYSWLWALTFDEESIERDLERAKEEGRLVEHVGEDGETYTSVQGSGSFNVQMNLLNFSDDNHITYDDLLLWLTINDLLDTGDMQLVLRFMRSTLEKPKAKQEPPALEAIAPEYRIVPNSKVTQVLRQGKSSLLFEEGGQSLRVDRKNRQIQLALWNDGETAIEVSDKIDSEDIAVIEAVTTLKHAGNSVMTPSQIIRNMGYKATPELIEEVHSRVLRLMEIKGRIDWTQQAKGWNLKNPDTGEPYEHAEIIGNLLSMTVFVGTDVKGNRDIRYKVASDPITYEHARLVHQVIEYPPELLELAPIDEDNKELKRVNREQKKLERAVLWYVYSLKSPKNAMSSYVTYEALFDYEGFTPGSDSSRKRAIKFIHAYLRALVKAGVIYTFMPKVEQSRRHLQTGITITVEKPGKGKKK